MIAVSPSLILAPKKVFIRPSTIYLFNKRRFYVQVNRTNCRGKQSLLSFFHPLKIIGSYKSYRLVQIGLPQLGGGLEKYGIMRMLVIAKATNKQNALQVAFSNVNQLT